MELLSILAVLQLGLQAGIAADLGVTELSVDVYAPTAAPDLVERLVEEARVEVTTPLTDPVRAIVTPEAEPAPDDPANAPLDAPIMAGVAGAVAAASSPFWLPWLRLLGAGMIAPMYSRLQRDDLLKNGVRDTLYKAIQRTPGIAMKPLAELGGAGWGATVYHLRRLEDAGMVRSERVGHHRRYFASGAVDRRDQEALGLIHNATVARIAEYLVRTPGASQKEVCQAVGISPSLAHKHLGRLADAGMVDKEREWRTVRYTPSQRLQPLLATIA